jgi:redox-sensitive bicupin YhaK (pirin superfamily)
MNTLPIQSTLTVQPMAIGEGFRADGIRGDAAVLDPFLMADHYWMSQPTFGPHPHAGFSAVTYMFDDAETGFNNRDSRGNQNVIRAGDVHWTVAGAGVLHDEVPQAVGKTAHGLQMFINLAAADKHCTPRVVHIAREAMSVVDTPTGASVKVVFGGFDNGQQQVAAVAELPTDATLFDVRFKAGDRFVYTVPKGSTAFLLVVGGAVTLAERTLAAGQSVAFTRDGGELAISALQASQVAVFMGQPLNDPVVRHGPFAMTNQADIERAISDYKAGRMGTL